MDRQTQGEIDDQIFLGALPVFPASPIRLGLTLGDVTGIGPEVAVKALVAISHSAAVQHLLIGDFAVVQSACEKAGVPIPRRVASIQDWKTDSVAVWQPQEESLSSQLPTGSTEAALAAVDWLREGALACLRGELSGLVTAPVSKEAILKAGIPFVGQTEYLTALSGNPPTGMMLLGTDDRGRWLRVLLATTHHPLREVVDQLSSECIRQSIELAVRACRQLKLPLARIAVCGLNPHAGEGGRMGTEELEIISPAVRQCQSEGLDVKGPFPADTLFHQVYRGDYDVVVAMYHDQGLVPLKMVAFDSGVNWTVGLPFVRTSPDHGTAYDIVGKGVANPSSMVAAIHLAHGLLGVGD